ncbi:MAG: HAD-IC family P-type ATPase [Oscillospiraceae bacterium]|nr:HAD-IC family P-type ATPase [Oscillospiraceae bacterium]
MKLARKQQAVRLNKVLSRLEPSADRGLTSSQARERLENGYGNTKPDSAEKTVGQIFKDNIFTYLNLVLILLGLCVILVGSHRDLVFMPIVVINTTIGIIQELRSKRALAKLSFIAAPSATVIRDGAQMTIATDEAVLDDIAVFSAGHQIYADAVVIGGECHVNEALVTGESDEITKTPGDILLSGSFVVSGECAARLDKVGRDSFVAQLTLEAKKTRSKLSTGMVSALKRLVQVIGIVIIPVGIAMFFQQLRQPLITIAEATVNTVGALVGMIPDGLYLLVSMALTVSVLRLARKKTLVQERNCVETLARVDVLCVDKTGTITETTMEVKGMALLCSDRFEEQDINMIMADYAGNMPADNETMIAVKSYFNAPPGNKALRYIPFSSATKYSGVTFHQDESYFLGAPEKILLGKYEAYRDEIEQYSAQGYRVLLLALYDSDISAKLDYNRVLPLALILLSNRVRPEAPGTFRFFAKQGVKIIVISGDNPVTVSQISREAGIEGAERFIDAAELTTDRQIKRAIKEYVVFGRVTPEQKRKLVRALKSAGHTVAMTGDGVNDVLALKDANCSIAMASGSEVASQVSDIVLLDSDFSAMPAVVMEGRRVINNIERSAALFITKNIFSFLFATIMTIGLQFPFPLVPSQFTLFNVMLIGIPSFVLAMEPNKNIVRGRFIVNVLRNSLPAGLTDIAAMVALVFIGSARGISDAEISTMVLIVIAFVGLLMLYKLSHPLNALRIALIVVVVIGFSGGAIVFYMFGFLTPLSSYGIWTTILVCVAAVPVFIVLTMIMKSVGVKQ